MRKSIGAVHRAWRLRLGTAALALCAAILPMAASAQQAAPPLPKPGAPDKSKGMVGTLKQTEPVLVAYFTGLAAIKYCKFGSEKNVAALGQGFGVTPSTVDASLVKRILSDIDSQVAKGRLAFCQRAWDRYGAHGTEIATLLTMPGTADVAGWTIEPVPPGGANKCEAYRKREGIEEYLDKFFGSAKKPASPDVEYAVATPQLTFELFETPPAVIEIGSARHQSQAVASDDHEVSVTLSKEAQEQLRQAETFTLRVKDTTITVPLKSGADVLAKLQACVDANDPTVKRFEDYMYHEPK